MLSYSVRAVLMKKPSIGQLISNRNLSRLWRLGSPDPGAGILGVCCEPDSKFMDSLLVVSSGG